VLYDRTFPVDVFAFYAQAMIPTWHSECGSFSSELGRPLVDYRYAELR
jgi:hypothetical protein